MHHTLQSGVQNYKHFLNYQNFSQLFSKKSQFLAILTDISRI